MEFVGLVESVGPVVERAGLESRRVVGSGEPRMAAGQVAKEHRMVVARAERARRKERAVRRGEAGWLVESRRAGGLCSWAKERRLGETRTVGRSLWGGS